MIEKQNSKEKVLHMLTEIYDQLEELESVLEYSLTDLRINMGQQQLDQINKAEEKINKLEQSMTESAFSFQVNKETYQNLPPALKLELGF
ncbi:hypothetical protein [Neobacillus sp. D3-1R]|uniref:hypothetical protein n=1 Tax=Neobacillus sp. D3-1R TaxID=3445778 RepID=UPI003FA089DD